MRRPTNIFGETFGRLTVIDIARKVKYDNGKSRSSKVYWNCECSCGNRKEVESTKLRSGHTRSCGCLRAENPQTFYNDIMVSCRNGAKARGLSFELSASEFESLVKGNCSYCGSGPASQKKRKPGGISVHYNGIDRINSSKGYSIGNVATCCANCNRAKWKMNVEEFVSHCERIVAHMRGANG